MSNAITNIADECYRLRVTDGPQRERAVALGVEAYIRAHDGMGLAALQRAAHANAVAKGFYEGGRPRSASSWHSRTRSFPRRSRRTAITALPTS